MNDIIIFISLTGLIFYFGNNLNHYGEALAEKTKIGKEWMGLIIMSSITSLPELIVGVTSSYHLQSSDIAIGDVLGSCAFNLGLLSFLDVFTPKDKPLLSAVSNNQILAASLGIILMALVGMGIYLKSTINFLPSIGFFSLLFAIIYILSVKILYDFSLRQYLPSLNQHNLTPPSYISLKKVLTLYIANAIIVVMCAIFLPITADRIAVKYQLGKTFVGTLFLAVSTSLPEVAVSIAAIRSGSIDMAVGNLLGSNLFNVFILFVDDLFYTKGVLLKDASPVHLITVLNVVLMSAVVIIGLTYKVPQKKYKFLMATDTLIVFLIFIFNSILIFKFSN